MSFGSTLTGMSFGSALLVEDAYHLDGTLGNTCAGAEDGAYASFVEEVVVLSRDNTAGGNEDVGAAEFLEFGDYLRDEGLVSGCERAYTEDVDVVFNILAIMIRG